MTKSWQEAFENPKCHDRAGRFKIVAQTIRMLITSKMQGDER